VAEICQEARRRGVAICVDGPHAPAQIPLSLDGLACDFYTASLHKWVSAPFGSGFLFVSPQRAPQVNTPLLSWGRAPPDQPTAWWHEFVWPGTRDPSAYFASTAALDLLDQVGLPAFRARTHFLAAYARRRLTELTGLAPATPDSGEWYGAMASAPLPPGAAAALQQALWREHGIEVPIISHNGRRSIRVSCHLYNSREDIDYLLRCLGPLLDRS
jgi:isopenicillin-N epimerase